MKRLFGLLFILVLMSMPAFAAKNSGSITVGQTLQVGSAQIPAGDYKVSWTGTDSNATVTISQNGKTVTTFPAKIQNQKNSYVSLDTKSVNGMNVLQTIQLDNVSLIVTGSGASGE
jgi:hypothetical protein